jgi:hypothetical protein
VSDPLKLPRLIGITGVAGVGKDTLADYLVREHKFVKYALADPIKELLNDRFGWTMEDWADREWKETGHTVWGSRLRASTLEECLPFSPRSWAQWLGAEVGRMLAGEYVWANKMVEAWHALGVVEDYYDESHLDAPQPQRMVVPDVRFDNEARIIGNLGGVVIRVVRQDAKPVEQHSSELGVDNRYVHCMVENYGAVPDFLARAEATLQDVRNLR